MRQVPKGRGVAFRTKPIMGMNGCGMYFASRCLPTYDRRKDSRSDCIVQSFRFLFAGEPKPVSIETSLFSPMGIQTAHYATRMFTQKEGDLDGKNK